MQCKARCTSIIRTWISTWSFWPGSPFTADDPQANLFLNILAAASRWTPKESSPVMTVATLCLARVTLWIVICWCFGSPWKKIEVCYTQAFRYKVERMTSSSPHFLSLLWFGWFVYLFRARFSRSTFPIGSSRFVLVTIDWLVVTQAVMFVVLAVFR